MYFLYNINFCRKIIELTKYSGYIEFEFLQNNKKIYIMECNPRIDGSIRSPLYFKEIINKNMNLKLLYTNRLLKLEKNKYNKNNLHFNILIELIELCLY